jgi:hypothetical protein
MDVRANLPVALPLPNPTVSYWQDPPDAEIASYLTAEKVPETADVVIIGSGITGSSVAWNLLNDTSKLGKVVMLEARQACSGATGRNGNSNPSILLQPYLLLCDVWGQLANYESNLQEATQKPPPTARSSITKLPSAQRPQSKLLSSNTAI